MAPEKILSTQEYRHTRLATDSNITILRGGHEYFEKLIGLISAAQHCIHLQTYIFDDDSTGTEVASALKEAARRHVNVYLLADGYASQVMAQHFIDGLRAAGIHFRFFEPVIHSSYFYFGRRLHQKVAVFDKKAALVGGLNIADRYNDLPGQPAWLDFALYTEGEVAAQLDDICWKTWCGVRSGINSKSFEKPPGIEPHQSVSATDPVHIRRNDWVRKKNEITLTYVRMLQQATSHITIVCSYFLPGKLLRRHISAAAKRGVQVTLITAGVSDVRIAKMAERWMYDWLLRHDIKVLEYQPGVLHAKLAICDDTWFTLGSYNINDLSAYASIELNLDVYDPFLCKRINGILQNLITSDCLLQTADEVKRHKNVFIQVARFFAYQIIRFVFHTLTFYYRPRS
ncbi:phosphatidylserine/phosphatidylglycerophosphate/cardiolipin synthase family protein [Ferruginibacter sp. HRS2-29]|uniref:phospholipase D-like domain-containing protein n=1 Tax=Ferruginibacter sp. HRS2-29 TaxID=2487334 RepID=UPI0020CE64B4|nr:phospholipase D-like domain-containing protein [Ferruginibacter sp. HRS2-29]